MKTLVTGASGYVGGRLVPQLLLSGHAVRCMVRDSSRFQFEGNEKLEVVKADPLHPDSRLNDALTGIDVAYYLIHSMDKNGKQFEERDRAAARNFATAAKAARVKRIIYLGGLGSANSQMSSHLKSRQETGDVLRQYGPEVVEFRAAIIVGNGSISFEIIRLLAERLPVMICPRWVITRVQPIAIKDVLGYLVAAADRPMIGETVIVEIGGASIESYNSMMLTYARVRGLRRWMLRVPVLTPRLSSYWLDLVTPIPPSISRPLIEGLRSEVICHDQSAAKLFPDIRPVDYETAVRNALHREIPFHLVARKARSGGASRMAHCSVCEQGFIFDVRESEVKTTAERTFAVVEGIGGKRGWLYADLLWQLRGLADLAIGGIGMRRGRSDPDRLRVDDVLDFWRVEEIDRPRLLRLRAEMKVPGKAWLQFECSPVSATETTLRTTAIFEPLGLAGEFYWRGTYPAHSLIFSGMHRAIAAKAENDTDKRNSGLGTCGRVNE